MTEYNIYCDESCHLEHDNSNVMALGAVYCQKDKCRDINRRIFEIKKRNQIPQFRELKWTKIGPSGIQAYIDLINYFFDDDDLHFRVLLVPNKRDLDHDRFNQDHDTWYYKMYFAMLNTILSPEDVYNIYIDIKDTNTYARAKKLHDVCANSKHDFSKRIIQRLQPIRSHEVQIMQVTDILTGAVTHYNRFHDDAESHSSAKLELINLIKDRSGYSLRRTTLLREDKFNIFVWEAQ